MVKKRLDRILDTFNKKSFKPLIIILIVSILRTSLLIGCNSEKEKTGKLTDELYEFRTEYIGDNSKVGNIVANIEWANGFEYKSMQISTDTEPYTLVLNFDVDKYKDFTVDKFSVQSAILFSLIGNLDEIVYVQRNSEVEGIIPLNREYIDNMTISVLGMETEYIGTSKEDFKRLVENTTILLDSTNEMELKPTKQEMVNNVEGVTMTIKERTADRKGLTLIFYNKSDVDLIYSNDFVIEEKIDEKWYELPVVPVVIEGNYGFNSIGYGLDAGRSREFKLEWGWMYGELKQGEYRIIKSITNLRGSEDFDTYNLATGFYVD